MSERGGRPAPALLWFRNDLRLSDHAALLAAVAGGRAVACLFVLDEAAAGKWAPGGAARWWLHHSLAALGAALAAAGQRLILRRGPAEAEIAEAAVRTGAAEVHAGRTAEPWARAQEGRVAQALARHGIALRLHRTATLFDPEALHTRSGAPFQVYSPFARASLATGGPPPPLPPPGTLPPPAAPDLHSEALEEWGLLPIHPDWAGGLRATWTPGEAAAQRRLTDFASHGLSGYAANRDLPGEDGTSRLSPHLRWGEISPAQAWHAAAGAPAAAAGKFRGELLWREFSHHLLWHFPTLPEAPLKPAFARIPWRQDRAGLRAWQRGRTGVPIVDAGMRQLWQTGWMHNRVRLVAASFLVKHLLIDWRAGEAWFWDTLVDADLANNSASWQWVAGSGADAAPFFRIFNPVLQGRKFDPTGAYVRRFVPELAGLPPEAIHAPWEAPVLANAGGYPEPIVDLAQGRRRALEALAAVGRT